MVIVFFFQAEDGIRDLTVTGVQTCALPSVGLVPTYPADWAWDTLQVEGPVARTAEDVALMLQAVAGPSPLSPLAQPTAGRNFVAAAAPGLPPGLPGAYCPRVGGIGIDPAIE